MKRLPRSAAAASIAATVVLASPSGDADDVVASTTGSFSVTSLPAAEPLAAAHPPFLRLRAGLRSLASALATRGTLRLLLSPHRYSVVCLT